MNNKQLEKLKEKVNIIFKDADYKKILKTTASLSQDNILTIIRDSGLRGRGGAGFPTAIKWQSAMLVNDDIKYIICNADEGEPGTFKDKMILEKQAEKVLTGMAIAAKAIGAHEGFIYLRFEYNFLKDDLIKKIAVYNALFNEFSLDFKVSLRSGSGAYICGEETALIESMEGKRGEPRNKPPLPIYNGYLGKPTVINNVETLAYASMIILDGPEHFKSIGTSDSMGGKVFSVSGDTGLPGVYELPLGMTISEFVEIFGSEATGAVQVGGYSGKCIPRKNFKNTIIGFEGVPTGGSMMLFDSSRSMYRVLSNILDFFQEESCGQCTPCRVGCQQLIKGIEAIRSGKKEIDYINELKQIATVMALSSKCGLGQSVANPFNSIITNYRDEVCY